MANLLDLRNKINSTKNTGQITRALEMVSAARQKKAQDFLNTSRFLRIGIRELMEQVGDIGMIETDRNKISDLFQKKDSNNVLIVTLMSQRGLCGSMNSSLFFEILKFKKTLPKEVEFISVNKVAQKYLKNFKEPVISYFGNIKENPELDDVMAIIDFVKKEYVNYETIYLAYTQFIKSGIFQPKIVQLLPIEQIETKEESDAKHNKEHQEYSVEPDPYTLLASLGNIFIEFEIYEAVLSNQASEHSARMIAMKKATDNVKEITKTLTLKLNKERQAKITQAMAEISANI